MLRDMLFILVIIPIVLTLGIVIGYSARKPIPITYQQKREIAIDFMAHGVWRYALCNNSIDTPMDSMAIRNAP